MAYQIEYLTVQKKFAKGRRLIRLPVLILLCFSLFLFLVKTLWTEGSVVLDKLKISSDGAVTVSALDEFADALYDGEGLLIAISDLYRNLIS